MESTPMLVAVAVRKRLLDSNVVANPKKSSLGVNDSISFASLFLRAQHAGELQEGESGGNVEAVGADERANVNLHLTDGKGAEHIQHGGGAAASACAAQPIEDGERCEERDGRA